MRKLSIYQVVLSCLLGGIAFSTVSCSTVSVKEDVNNLAGTVEKGDETTVSESAISDSEIGSPSEVPRPTADYQSDISTSDFFLSSPADIELLFGAPLSSETFKDGNELYYISYDPAPFANAFPDAVLKSLSVRFENDQATSVALFLDTPVPGMLAYGGTLPEDAEAGLALKTLFFEALFKDEKPNYTAFESTHPGMSLQVYDYCVAPGVGTSLVDSQLYELRFSKQPEC